jgi:uncharacterized protein
VRTTMEPHGNPYEIQIDKDGIWYFRGTEMIRHDIVQYFYQHLKSDNAGLYYIEIDNERCPVGVEDVPYVITAAELITPAPHVDEKPRIIISLTDGNTEVLDLKKPLRQGKDNVLYCKVRKDKFEARFSRPAYYQFCSYIDYEPNKEGYVVNLNRFSLPFASINKKYKWRFPC